MGVGVWREAMKVLGNCLDYTMIIMILLELQNAC